MENEVLDSFYPKSCGRFTTIHFIEYLWQRLPITRAEEIDQHILTCAPCLAHLNYWSALTHSARVISPVLINSFTPLWQAEVGKLKYSVMNDIPYWLMARPLLNMSSGHSTGFLPGHSTGFLPDGWLDDVVKVQAIIQQRQQQYMANTCAQWSESQLIKFCLRELEPSKVIAFTTHLKECSKCQEQFHRLLTVMPATSTPQVWSAIKTELVAVAENTKNLEEWPKQGVTTMLVKAMFAELGKSDPVLPPSPLAEHLDLAAPAPSNLNNLGGVVVKLWQQLRQLRTLLIDWVYRRQ
jgi:anti-sigma factor RsiW